MTIHIAVYHPHTDNRYPLYMPSLQFPNDDRQSSLSSSDVEDINLPKIAVCQQSTPKGSKAQISRHVDTKLLFHFLYDPKFTKDGSYNE